LDQHHAVVTIPQRAAAAAAALSRILAAVSWFTLHRIIISQQPPIGIISSTVGGTAYEKWTGWVKGQRLHVCRGLGGQTVCTTDLQLDWMVAWSTEI